VGGFPLQALENFMDLQHSRILHHVARGFIPGMEREGKTGC